MARRKSAKDRAGHIREVAARLFGQKGYRETAMSEIVSASGVSKGAIYHYFPQKDDILFAVLDKYMDLVITGLEGELALLDNGETKIRHVISRHINLYVENLFAAKTLLHDAQVLPPELYRVIANKQRKYHSVVAAALHEYSDDQIAGPELKVLTFTLFGMCNWIYSWYDPKKSIDPSKLSDMIFNVFIAGAKSALK